MSDFLSRLAERALGVAKAVEPRLPAVFEPAAPAMAEPAPAAAREPVVRVETGREVPSRMRVREPRVTERTVFLEKPGPSSPPAAEPHPGEAASPPAQPPVRLREPDAPREAAEPKPAAPRPAAAHETVRPVVRIERRTEAGPTILRETNTRVDNVILREPRRETTARIEREAAPRQQAGRQPEPVPDGERPATALSAGLRDKTVPPFPMPALKRREKPDAPPQTTVQVTIGRVEVRAAPPAAAPRRRAPSPPVMSLEEYLRRRGGES